VRKHTLLRMGLGLLAALVVWPAGPAAAQTSPAPATVLALEVTSANYPSGDGLVDTYHATVRNDTSASSVYFYVWAQVSKETYPPKVITHDGADEPVGKNGWSVKLAPGDRATVTFTVNSSGAERYCARSQFETPVCSEVVNPLPSATVLHVGLVRSTYYDPNLEYQEQHWDWVQVTVRNDTLATNVSFDLSGEEPSGPFTPTFVELFGGVAATPGYASRWVVQNLAPGAQRIVSLRSVQHPDAARYCALGLLSDCSSSVIVTYG
jgi:hypothetical protein